MEPTVGMGATLILWSDRHAYTITRVSKSGKTFWMKRDHAKRTDKNGLSESQIYEYSPDLDAREVRVYLNKDGKWIHDRRSVVVGKRMEYYDPSF